MKVILKRGSIYRSTGNGCYLYKIIGIGKTHVSLRPLEFDGTRTYHESSRLDIKRALQILRPTRKPVTEKPSSGDVF